MASIEFTLHGKARSLKLFTNTLLESVESLDHVKCIILMFSVSDRTSFEALKVRSIGDREEITISNNIDLLRNSTIN
jgi:hypothetical protein